MLSYLLWYRDSRYLSVGEIPATDLGAYSTRSIRSAGLAGSCSLSAAALQRPSPSRRYDSDVRRASDVRGRINDVRRAR